MLNFDPLPRHSNLKLLNNATVRKYGCCSLQDTYRFMEQLFQYLMCSHAPEYVVKVLGYSMKGKGSSGVWQYTYDMERCFPISSEEKNVVQIMADADTKRYNQSCLMKRDQLYVSQRHDELIKFCEDIIR